MKRQRIQQVGQINANGELKMYMGELKQFFQANKGCRIMATFRVYPTGTSEVLRGYYYHCVVPTMQQAMYDFGERMTQEDTDIYLRNNSPVCIEEEFDVKGVYHRKLKEITELTDAELTEHIDCIKQFAAENFSVFIEEPRTL